MDFASTYENNQILEATTPQTRKQHIMFWKDKMFLRILKNRVFKKRNLS